MAAIKLKDLLEGQQRLAQRENMPLEQSENKLQKLVDAIAQKTSPAVNLNSNQKIFEDFVKQTQKREELLKDATSEQIVIFKHLEDTIKKLKDAGHADSIDLRKAIENLANKLKATPATSARSNIMRTLTAPVSTSAKSPKPPVTPTPRTSAATASKQPTVIPPTSPTGYSLYEDAASVGDTDDSRAVMGEADPTDKNQGLGLGDLLAGVLAGKALKDISSRKTAKSGSTIATAESKSAKAKGGFKKDAQGRWRNSAGQYVKKPSLLARAADKVKGPLKTLGKVATKIPFIAPLVTGAMAGFNEYEKSGDITKAAVVGGSTAIAGEAATVAGTLAGGPVVGLIAGTAAAAGAEAVSGGLYDAVTTPALPEAKPSSSTKTASTIRDITIKNQDIADTKSAAPVVINNSQPMAMPSNNQTTYMPRADVRPSENALERYINRSYSV